MVCYIYIGKNLNHYISDISIVMSYCESHVTRADMLVSINPDEDETSKFWYQYFQIVFFFGVLCRVFCGLVLGQGLRIRVGVGIGGRLGLGLGL